MRVAHLDIENFRSIESESISFSPLTALVGRNGAGKSTALTALAMFYNISAQLTEHDYFNCDTSRTIRLRVTFDTLTPEEQREFASYIFDGRLTVTKVITTGGATYRGSRLQIPQFAPLRQLSFRTAAAALRDLVGSEELPGLNGSPRGQDALDAILNDYEAAHPELCQPVESETQFLGPANIGGGLIDKYTKFVRIPAVRDASGEVDRKGAILQLLDILVLRSLAARPEVAALNAELEQRVREIYSRDNLRELDRLATQISTLLRRYAPDAALELDFAAVQAPKVPTPQPRAALLEDDFRCPISHTGHGLQRALIFALLEQLAVTEAAIERDAEDARQENEPNDRREPDAPPCLILTIEEPELYLHPPRSRFLARTLLGLTRTEAPTTQVCYATHSPFYVGLDRFDCIRLARKTPSHTAPIKKTTFMSYTATTAAQALRELAEGNVGDFTAETFAVRASPVMSNAVNEGFFADVVVVVEGLCDAAILAATQELLGEAWDEKGIVVVPALGKANIDRPVVVFRGFQIPTYFVFDGDADCGAGDRVQTVELNRRLCRLARTEAVDFPPTDIRENVAFFHNDIEDELQSANPEFYARERAALARQFGFPTSKHAKKNPELAALYVRRAHSAGALPESLVQTVLAISRLRGA